MSENNEWVLNSFKQFLQSYDCGKSGLNVKTTHEITVQDLSTNESNLETVVLRNRQTSDSCFFSDHTISPNDVEPEVFDWVYYHLDYKKCPYPLAFALSSIVARKLGLAERTRESQSPDADQSKPALSSNELYSQSLEYLTDYINSWKQNPEIAVEIAKEYSGQPFITSICALKNIRRKMEDRHVILHDLNKALNLNSAKQYSYYAIFDGHAGVDAASYSSAHLHHHLVNSQAFIDGDISGAFKEAFSLTDLHYLERSARENKKSGSTALCALLVDKSKLYVAWLGDSQAVLIRNGKPIDIMIPHKPELEEERKRIEELGGFVAYVDTWRVNGTLAVSRAIGDPEHKPYISSEPGVVELDIDSDTDFLVLGCDGLWDQMTPEEATTLVYQYICENSDQNTQEISENLSRHLSKVAKDDGSCDNITTIVILFKDLSQLKATHFQPLTPRQKSETNGLNGNHFQFNETDFIESQKANNPFDMSWSTGSSYGEMNNAKLNIETNDSLFGSEISNNDSKSNSNPFDLNHQRNPFQSLDNNHSNNELLSGERLNSFDVNDDRLESDLQLITNNANSIELQSDSQFNISKLSDISASFPTQSEHALCSTPIQTSEPFSINSVSQENIVFKANMDPFNDFEQSSGAEATDQQKDSFSSGDMSGYQTAYEQDIEKNLMNSDDKTPIQTPIKLEEVCDQVFKDVDESNDLFNPNQDINDFSSGAESVDSFCYEKISADMNAITKRVENDFNLDQRLGTEDKTEEIPINGFATTANEADNHFGDSSAEESQEMVYQLIDEKQSIQTADEEHEEMIAPDVSLVYLQTDLVEEHKDSDELQEVVPQSVTEQQNNDHSVPKDVSQSSVDIPEGISEDISVDIQVDKHEDKDLYGEEMDESIEAQLYSLKPEAIEGQSEPQEVVSQTAVEESIGFIHKESEDWMGTDDSVDALCYQKINSDLSGIAKRVENDLYLQQNYLSLKPESDQRLTSEDNVVDNNEDIYINNGFSDHFSYEEPEEVIPKSMTEKPIIDSTPYEQLNAPEVYSEGIEEHKFTTEVQEVVPQVMAIPTEPEIMAEIEEKIEVLTSNSFEGQLVSREGVESTIEPKNDFIEGEQEFIEREDIKADPIEEHIIPEEPKELLQSLVGQKDLDLIVNESEELIETQMTSENTNEFQFEDKMIAKEVEVKSLAEQQTHEGLIASGISREDLKSDVIEEQLIPKAEEVVKDLVSELKVKSIAEKSNTSTKPPLKASTKAMTTAPKVGAKTTSTVSSKPITSPTKKTTTTATTKPLTEKTSTKPLSAAMRPKTTTSRPTVALASKPAPKPSAASKPVSQPLESRNTSSSRLTSTAARPATTATRAPASKSLDSKPIAKSASTRPPVSSMTSRPPVSSTTSRTATNPRTASSTVPSRTLASRPTATSSATTSGAQMKSTLSSNITRKTTTQTSSSNPTQSSVNGVKPSVNGVKQPSPTKSTLGVKSTASRVNTGRVGMSTTTKPATASAKTSTTLTKSTVSSTKLTGTSAKPSALSKTSSIQPKTGVKSTSDNKPKAVPKSSTVPKPNGNSPPLATTTSAAKSNNPLKVTNSLKQELEDADLMHPPALENNRNNILTPDSEANISSPDTMEKAFILSNSEYLSFDSSPDVNGNN